MEAVVLAGGFGTRMRAVVADVPKPMAPVAGRPFLDLLLGALARKGVRRTVLSLCYVAELIERHFGARYGALELACEVEVRPLGTGCALRRALAHCRGEAALVVNGDTCLDLEQAEMRHAWLRAQQPLIVGLEVPDTLRYGRLRVAQGRLQGFTEKATHGPGVINTGHYLLPTRLFKVCTLPDPFSLKSDFLAPNVERLHFGVFIARGPSIDIGVPEGHLHAQTQLAGLA